MAVAWRAAALTPMPPHSMLWPTGETAHAVSVDVLFIGLFVSLLLAPETRGMSLEQASSLKR